MSVAFGIQRKQRHLTIIRTICAGCHDKCAHELCGVRARFRLTCRECGASTTVSREKADLLLSSAERVDEQTPVPEGSVAV